LEQKKKNNRIHIYIHLTRADTAAKNTDFVKRCLRVDLGKAADVDDGVLAERGRPDEVEDRFPSDAEARLAVADHDASVHVDPEEVAHVALLRLAVGALPALAREHREDVVARGQIGHAFSHALHDPAVTKLVTVVMLGEMLSETLNKTIVIKAGTLK
jgi:hypothetical protein